MLEHLTLHDGGALSRINSLHWERHEVEYQLISKEGRSDGEEAQVLEDGMLSHGMSYTKEHRAWCSMKTRCFNENEPGYARYGGRGITVYEPWRASFEAFYEHIGPCPSSSHSLDRFPDPNGNYEPGNVRWATAQEQALNRRSNVLLKIGSRTMTITEWSREIGVSFGVIKRRFADGAEVDLSDARPARGRGENTYRGVHLRGSGRYSAVLWNGSKLIQLGTFDSPEQAHVEWLMAKVSNV